MVCPITTELRQDFGTGIRPVVSPSEANGLREVSQLMLDKLSAVPRTRVGQVIGSADAALMATVTTTLAVMLDIGSLDPQREQ